MPSADITIAQINLLGGDEAKIPTLEAGQILMTDDTEKIVVGTTGGNKVVFPVTAVPAGTDAQIVVFSGTTPTAVDMSGGATIDNTGAVTLNILAADLPASGVTPGTYGESDGTAYPQIVIDAAGRVTSATEVTVAGGGGGWTPPAGTAGQILVYDSGNVLDNMTMSGHATISDSAVVTLAPNVTISNAGAVVWTWEADSSNAAHAPTLTARRALGSGANSTPLSGVFAIDAQAKVSSAWTTVGTITNVYTGNGSTTRGVWIITGYGAAGSGRIEVDDEVQFVASAVNFNTPLTGPGPGVLGLNASANAVGVATPLGSIVHGGASGALSALAGNTTTTKKFLRETGDGTNATAPVWDTLAESDLPLTTTGSSSGLVTFNVTADNTLQASGIKVTLPSAGRWKVTVSLVGIINNNTLSATLSAHVKNNTTGNYLTNPEIFLVRNTVTGMNQITGATRVFHVGTTGAEEIEVYGIRTTVGTYTTSQIYSGTLGRSEIVYERLGG